MESTFFISYRLIFLFWQPLSADPPALQSKKAWFFVLTFAIIYDRLTMYNEISSHKVLAMLQMRLSQDIVGEKGNGVRIPCG